MKTNGKIAVTNGLNNIIDGVPGEEVYLLTQVAEYTKEVTAALEQEIEGGTLAVLNEIDRLMKESNRENSCKRGCNFCCRINVDIYEQEAKLIAAYCKEKGIAINRNYLKKQLTYRASEIFASPVAACVFLKNGECSIYEVRPLICRKYLVESPAERCDAIRFRPPAAGVSIVNDLSVEIVASAFMNACGPFTPTRMPKALLKYSI